MNNIIQLSDCINPETGLTGKQENDLLQHKYPIGSLVELNHLDEEHPRFGVRLYVIGHIRDCDHTPLYSLSWSKDMEVYNNDEEHTKHGRDRFYNGQTLYGVSEKN